MMNFENYMEMVNKDLGFMPGMDAIYSTLDAKYENPLNIESYQIKTLGNDLFLGREDLEGFTSYSTPEFKHIVSFGCSELYGNPQVYGREVSKLGYELTLKINSEDEVLINTLVKVATKIGQAAIKRKINIEENSLISFNDNEIILGSGFYGFVVAKDSTLEEFETVHGSVKFYQLYPVDRNIIELIDNKKITPLEVIELAKERNKDLIISF